MAQPHDRTPELVQLLFDFVSGTPGKTIQQIGAKLGTRRRRTEAVISAARRIFSDDPENLVCDPQGQRDPWLYRFVDSMDDWRYWTDHQLSHLETHLETVLATQRSMVLKTDANTVDGKRARKLARNIDYLMQEIADLRA